MSANTQTLDQVIKRIVGAAFDAGVQAATRPRAEREAQRLDQAGYAAIMICAQVEAARLEAARLKATVDQLEADFLGKAEPEFNGPHVTTSTVVGRAAK